MKKNLFFIFSTLVFFSYSINLVVADSGRYCKCAAHFSDESSAPCLPTANCISEATYCVGGKTYTDSNCENEYITPEPPPPVDTSLEFKELKLEDLSKINPLKDSETFGDEGSRTLGNIVSVLLTMIIFPLAGLILFLMIVWGGYQILNGSLTGNQSKIDLGKNKITYAIYGFLLLFASWWLWSMVEIAIGINKN